MSESKRFEIKHDRLRMVSCEFCDELKLGANIYKCPDLRTLLKHRFLCDDCVSEIAKDWVETQSKGPTQEVRDESQG